MFSGLFFRLTNLHCFFQSLVLFCHGPVGTMVHEVTGNLFSLASFTSLHPVAQNVFVKQKGPFFGTHGSEPILSHFFIVFHTAKSYFPDAGARGAASAAAVVGGLCARRAAGGRLPWCRGAVARGTSV